MGPRHARFDSIAAESLSCLPPCLRLASITERGEYCFEYFFSLISEPVRGLVQKESIMRLLNAFIALRAEGGGVKIAAGEE